MGSIGRVVGGMEGTQGAAAAVDMLTMKSYVRNVERRVLQKFLLIQSQLKESSRGL